MRKVARFFVHSLAVLAMAGLSAPLAAQGLLDQIRFEPVAAGLDRAVGVVHSGDGSGRLFILSQAGRIFVHNGQQVFPSPFLDIADRVNSSGGEQGLLGLVFHPRYEENGFFYVNYTRQGGDTMISRFTVSQNANAADANSEMLLMRVSQPFSNHNAGDLHFGPDGFLYFGLGDGGSGGDPGDRAQNLSALLGKMLRIDVDGAVPYAIPASNPFTAQAGARGEIWAYGLRNPWRFSFDRDTGDMFIGDVGQNQVEEIDFQPASSRGGENYGWRRMEGNQCFNPGNNCNDGTLTLPILTYTHAAGQCSVTGGYRYRGKRFPQLAGLYFYGDYCDGRLHAARPANGAWSDVDVRSTGFSISSFGEDEAGELYIVNLNGTVYRIVADHPQPQLSQLSPSNAPAGSSAFTLVVRGSNFVPGAQVFWNGASRPTTFVDNDTLEAAIPASDLAAQGAVQVTVSNPAPGGGVSAAREFMVSPGISLNPSINQNGVVNAASFAAGVAVAPGSIVSVFGEEFAAGMLTADILPLPTALGGSTFRFNDAASPQFFRSARQANLQVPWELEGQPQATLRAETGGATSAAVAVALTRYAPGLFSLTMEGAGPGAALIAGTGLAAAAVGSIPGLPSRPARVGEFLEIYATGLGPVTNRPATGAPASQTTISRTLETATVAIGGAAAAVTFSGLAPGFAGLYQVNAEIQPGTPNGAAVPVVLTIGGAASNTVTVAVE